jgi:uncharacterized protein (TIGR03000 family)
MPPKNDEKLKEPKAIDPKTKSLNAPLSPNKAQVVVNLPADAKLFANGQLTALTSSERSFVSPVLEQGREYQYSLKVEYVRDGRTITDAQVVKVRPGDVSRVEFADVSATAASTIKVTIPEGAKLFVDNQFRELPSGTKEFKTPLLVKGSEYFYNFRAELTIDGKKQEQTQRVVFKAGELVSVDFSDMNAIRTAQR